MFFRDFRCKKHIPIRWTLSSLEPRLLLAGDVQAEFTPSAPNAEPTPVDAVYSPDVDLAVAADTKRVASVVFIDSRVEDFGALAGAVATDSEIVLIDGGSDGVQQITQHLGQRQHVQAVHLITHGSEGAVHFGNQELSTDNIGQYSDQLRAWRKALSGDADILLYGCETGKGSRGADLMQAISHLTGADVAASDDLTGNKSIGADWDLERTIGTIDASVAFSTDNVAGFSNRLVTITAQGENAPNETRNEAFDNDLNTKWLDFANANPDTRASWIQYQYDDSIVLSSYTISSANDAPERDPSDWTLSGSNDGVNFVPLDTRSAEFFSSRFQTRQFTIAGAAAYDIYRLDIHSVADPASANSVQISEIELIDDPDTVPEIITAQGENAPNETRIEAFDNDLNTKWLDFANANPDTRASWIQYQYSDNSVLSSYTISSANDAPERDPRDWTLSGSNDGVNFVTLDTRSGEFFSSRFQTRQFTVSGAAAYSIYRLDIHSVADPASANSVQISEIGLVGNPDTVPETITAQGENAPNETRTEAFDDDLSTKWLDFANANPDTRASWIQYRYDDNIVLSSYTISSANDAPERDPSDWTLSGSNDGVNFVTLDTRSGEFFSSRFQTRQFNVSGPAAYSIYRLDIQSVADPASANSVQISEIELISESAGGPGAISLESSVVDVSESAGNALVKVVRTGGSDGQITVDYDTEIGTATAGSDYTPVAGTLTFADGETEKTIVIPIIDNSVEESIEQFGVSIDNVLGGAVLLVPRTATVTIVDDDVALPNYPDFASTDGLTFNGDAGVSGDSLQLTPASSFQRGSVYYDQAVDLNNDASFRSAFSFQISGGSGGGDGFAFVIQNDSRGATALGDIGGYFGYEGVSNSVAVEFDTYQNAWDISNNHVSIIEGSVTNPLRTLNTSFDLNNGSQYYAWVDYNGDSDVLAVYLSDNATKPSLALLKTTVDLESTVGNAAFFGFSAGTGRITNSHKILNWQLDQQIPAQDPPTEQGDTVIGVDVVSSGLAQPTAIDWLPDGSMLIAEKGGVVKTFSGDTLSSSPFIDISDIVNGVRDRGLLDIAVHPDFENNPFVYLLFTYDPPEVFNQAEGSLAGPDGRGNRAGRLIRVTADASNNYLTAVAGSEVVLLGKNSTWDNFNGFTNSTSNFNEPPAGELPDGSYLQDFINSDSESHTVGGLAFAPDGALYVSIGDGASYNDVDVRGDRVQHIDSLSGKVLRIDPITGEGLPDNPFYNSNDANANRSKVYQLGLRNPFRISVDPVNGQLFVGDVGWTRWEEINSAGAGANFGWPFYEGGNGVSQINVSYQNTPEGQDFFADNVSVDASIYALNHQADGINAIVMGDVYRGSQYGAEYQGDVFFNDLGQGIVRHASIDGSGNVTDVNVFATGANVVVAIRQGPDGALYYVDLDDQQIGRWEFV